MCRLLENMRVSRLRCCKLLLLLLAGASLIYIFLGIIIRLPHASHRHGWRVPTLRYFENVFAQVVSSSVHHFCYPVPIQFVFTASDQNRLGRNVGTAGHSGQLWPHFGHAELDSLYQSFVPCDWRENVLRRNCSLRLTAVLRCSYSSAEIVYEWVSADAPPRNFSFEDECLREVTRSKCTEDPQLIPKLVHYVMLGGREMPFHTFLSMLSAVRFVRPCLVLFHADTLPFGPYWDTLLRLVPHIIHVTRQPPTSIFGNKVEVVQHQSDIVRMEAVMRFGGMYFDSDYFLLNSLDDLRHHDFVIGVEVPNQNFGNGVFLAKEGAKFLGVWYDSYRTFNDSMWGEHSLFMPFKIHKERPDVPCHSVNTFLTPSFINIKEAFYENATFSWDNIHGLHTYIQIFPSYFEGDYEKKNSTVGKVARLILFGDSDSCFSV